MKHQFKELKGVRGEELRAALKSRVEERCNRNRLRVTLWLLFDTAAQRNGVLRDKMLVAFKKYARVSNRPRSVAEGIKWLAEYWEEWYED